MVVRDVRLVGARDVQLMEARGVSWAKAKAAPMKARRVPQATEWRGSEKEGKTFRVFTKHGWGCYHNRRESRAEWIREQRRVEMILCGCKVVAG